MQLKSDLVWVIALAVSFFSGCTGKPLIPYSTDTTPLVLMPAIQKEGQDQRGRFREIFCEILQTRADTLPDYRPCEQALTRVGNEPQGSGRSVDLGPSKRRLTTVIVPGIGWDCVEEWLDLQNTVPGHLQQFGYEMVTLKVDGLSSTANNAKQIRDALMAMPDTGSQPDLVLVGYSKGAPDILEAVATYPEIIGRIAAVISVAGAIGGSPLANDASQSQLNIMTHFPGAQCSPGDGGGLESLRPAVRKAWLAANTLPSEIAYYSVVTYPEPDRISSVLRSSYNKIGRVDGRNDSQVIFYDQFIPDSTLVAYLNADHWAIVVPVARTHSFVGSTFANKNDYPREALFEALARFIEEHLADSSRQ